MLKSTGEGEEVSDVSNNRDKHMSRRAGCARKCYLILNPCCQPSFWIFAWEFEENFPHGLHLCVHD